MFIKLLKYLQHRGGKVPYLQCVNCAYVAIRNAIRCANLLKVFPLRLSLAPRSQGTLTRHVCAPLRNCPPDPAGAYGCTISGAGPTAVAIVDDPEVGERVAAAMCAAFRSAGKLEVNTAQVCVCVCGGGCV